MYVGSNDITKFNYHNVAVDDLAIRIIRIGMKCRYYRVESITISSVFSKLILGVYFFINTCKVYGFDFMCKNRIEKDLLWRDDFHLTDEGTSFLAINFLNFLNSFQTWLGRLTIKN